MSSHSSVVRDWTSLGNSNGALILADDRDRASRPPLSPGIDLGFRLDRLDRLDRIDFKTLFRSKWSTWSNRSNVTRRRERRLTSLGSTHRKPSELRAFQLDIPSS
ncbi:hypothetical protein RV134_270353 [Roseovarius sp. EC-HK134]|nr:hypothetical protein RV134_270353 [Roseovarius sp. EC-HK134]